MNRFVSIFLCLGLAWIGARESHGQELDLNRAFAAGVTAFQAGDYDKALDTFVGIVRAAPDRNLEQVQFHICFCLYYARRHREAADTFEAFLAKYPNHPQAAELHLCAARSLLELGNSNAEPALTHLAEARKKPALEEEARYLAADAYLAQGDMEKATELLQASMKANSADPATLRATLHLVDLCIKAGDLPRALDVLRRLEDSPGYPDVIVTVNHRFVEIGDRLLGERSYAEALAAYSSARLRNQVMAIQTARLAEMSRLKKEYEDRIASAAQAKQPLPRNVEEMPDILGEIIANTEETLNQLATLKDYDAILQYRIARCFYNMDRFWTAGAAFEAVAEEAPDFSDAPTALYGAILCQWKLKRPAAASKLCDSYLSKYATGSHAAMVAELNANLLLQQGAGEQAITFLDTYLKAHPRTKNRETFLTLLANARFQAKQYEPAAATYDALREEFPQSELGEEFVYRRALCDFLRGDYQATSKAFDAYDAAYPGGLFRSDIRYRRGIIQLAFQDYDGVISSMEAMLKEPEVQAYAGQVHTLLGDAWAAKDDPVKAAGHYADAVRSANQDDAVLRYSLDQAVSLYRSTRRTTEVITLWQDFIQRYPNHPLVLRGVAELSKLFVRTGKGDEARQMLIEHALKEIHNPRAEYVEPLLSQLASFFVPKRSALTDAPQLDANAIEAELTKVLELPENLRSDVYWYRVLFAKAELARMMRDPARHDRLLHSIANLAKPEDLGPALLALLGPFLIDQGQFDRAKPYLLRLRDSFPESSYSAVAPIGLGNIDLGKGNYQAALESFDSALSKAAANGTAKEATFGKALTMYRMSQVPEAKRLFETIVTTKEWRGREKAGALYYLGEIAAAAGDEGAANAYFQRVYLSYGAYADYVRKAALRSADMLAADGQHDSARLTLRTLVVNPKHAGTEEFKIAQERLKQ